MYSHSPCARLSSRRCYLAKCCYTTSRRWRTQRCQGRALRPHLWSRGRCRPRRCRPRPVPFERRSPVLTWRSRSVDPGVLALSIKNRFWIPWRGAKTDRQTDRETHGLSRGRPKWSSGGQTHNYPSPNAAEDLFAKRSSVTGKRPGLAALVGRGGAIGQALDNLSAV